MGLRAAIRLQLHAGISLRNRTRSKGLLSIISRRSICSSKFAHPIIGRLLTTKCLHQAYWRSEQQFPVEEKPLITPRQTETTSSAQSSYENTYTNSLRSYTSDAPGYPSTGELHNASIFIVCFIVSLVSKINIRVCLTKKK